MRVMHEIQIKVCRKRTKLLHVKELDRMAAILSSILESASRRKPNFKLIRVINAELCMHEKTNKIH